MQRREFLGGALAAVAPTAFAQGPSQYPNKPIRLVVPFPAGGGTDATSRLIAEKFTSTLGWTVVVDNKPGAGGNIGLDAVAKSAPDGYTIGMGQASNLAINPSLYAKMPFDPLRDLTPIVSVAEQPVVLVVRADSPLKTFADFVQAARARPGKVGIAQAGNGTVGHLAGELLERRAGVQVLQVPYKGAGPAMTDLLGGQVDTYFGNTVSVMGQLAVGKVRALAVSSLWRVSALPNVPTVAEQGYAGFDATTWLGLVGPANLPADVVARLNAETVKILARADVKSKLVQDGSEPTPGTPQQFAAQVRAEHAKWGTLIRDANIRIE
ncbi:MULTISPECIES: Bug family tripartite tricarboxylate transporter substrate binding protein [Ramlibacter]|uniref:Tripartite tricarboxylate transporter substrate binding protein n=1 Tax=Ramlibacter pinisoli TaxID=2682844 RepID=A0A6N8J0C5_9BURK|nr:MULTISPECIES: tripartite tricarboxylate transporter substrate binding protein [Ramlibacter]MBA2962353.1 tripartite tricarboxylate transporter substrate binding protein [Ramlibacter sp. CGMCC 1.13660]MVQ32295.1 tripartite tricarboxylate transporter substrate binding protein [Ramlibacter pinisoli]